MSKKPTYEDLEKRVRELEKEHHERKRAQEALRKSEERFRKVYDIAPLAFVVWDVNACIVDWNKTAEILFGWTKEEVKGNNFFDFLIPEKDRPHVQDVVIKLLQGELQSHSINDNLTKDKRTITCEWNNSPLHDDDGNIIGVISLGLDITERKLMEEEKAKLQGQLHQSQKMEAIGTLAGGIAHDFNNLLMGVQGNVSLCLLEIDSSHAFFERLTNIEKYIQNGIHLTRQLLGFARGGKYEVKPIDLNELIKNQNRMLGRTRRNVTIRGKYEKNLWSAEVDKGQIEQAIFNLYLNAWQAMPKGGNLNIQTENITFDEDAVKPYYFEPGKYVRISIADDGIGMDEATRKRIFEPFFTTK
ncbi:MAG: PAS domain S-box protein, partial [Desulfobacterales bacterium]